MKLFEAYKRWRHTRGYGVHSPFAYKIVKEVLQDKRGYAYYAYQNLEEAACSRSEIKAARRLMRLAARMDVGSTFLPADAKKIFLSALKGADSKMTVFSDPKLLDRCRLICTSGNLIDIDTIIRLIDRPGRIIALKYAPDGWLEKIFNSLDEGLMLYGRCNALIFSRPGMQKVKYSASI